MARGGKRQNAGRKTSWISGCRFEDTKLIRVPKVLSDKLLEFAHRLDQSDNYELVTKSYLSELESKCKKLPDLESQEKAMQLTLVDSSQSYELGDLIEKGKEIVRGDKVRSRDKAAVRKYYGWLLGVSRDLFK